jgi:hypothetical protein
MKVLSEVRVIHESRRVISLDFAAEFSSGFATYLMASTAAVGAGKRLQSAVGLIGCFSRADSKEATEKMGGPAERTGWGCAMQVACSSWMGGADG